MPIKIASKRGIVTVYPENLNILKLLVLKGLAKKYVRRKHT